MGDPADQRSALSTFSAERSIWDDMGRSRSTTGPPYHAFEEHGRHAKRRRDGCESTRDSVPMDLSSVCKCPSSTLLACNGNPVDPAQAGRPGCTLFVILLCIEFRVADQLRDSFLQNGPP